MYQKKPEPSALEVELQNYEMHGISILLGSRECRPDELIRENGDFVRESLMRDYEFDEKDRSLSKVRFDKIRNPGS